MIRRDMHRGAAAALVLLIAALCLAAPSVVRAAEGWTAVLEKARGQTVYFNAWGGSRPINDYIRWAADEVERRYGIHLIHVKLDDTARAVSTVLAEKAAGRTGAGTVDLVWINGENFAAMKANGLLLGGGWADRLPNRRYLDDAAKRTMSRDFTIPVEGEESPWGLAKLVFFHDSARTKASDMPHSASALLDWARRNPGRFSYPRPPDFTGTTFLKQVLSAVAPDPQALQKAPDDVGYARQTAPLFAYLDRLHPLLWHGGREFPRNYADLEQKLADGELDISFAFNPSEASAAIARGDLPPGVRAFTFDGGTLGNTHYLAIPFNSAAREAAMVVADFLLSPEAQLRKQDPQVWGDPTVLSPALLEPEMRARFAQMDLGVATPPAGALGPVLPEPHPDWIGRIEKDWTRRYGVGTP